MPGFVLPHPPTAAQTAAREKASKIHRDAETFVSTLHTLTGLDPDVIRAWARAEGAYAPGGTGGYNFLNMKASSHRGLSGVPLAGLSSKGFAQFHSPQDAATEAAYWINTMPNYRSIRAAVHHDPVTQIAAISSSPWDAGHYGGNGSKLLGSYNAVKGSGGGSWLGGVASTVGGVLDPRNLIPSWDSPAGQAVQGVQSAADAAKSAAEAIGWVMNPQHLLRIGYIIFGGVLVLAGAVLVARAVGAPVPMGVPDVKGAMPGGIGKGEAAHAARQPTSTPEDLTSPKPVYSARSRKHDDDIPF